MKYEAVSYNMGSAVQRVKFDAPSSASAVNHPAVRKLGAHAQGPRGKAKVVGIKLIRA